MTDIGQIKRATPTIGKDICSVPLGTCELITQGFLNCRKHIDDAVASLRF